MSANQQDCADYVDLTEFSYNDTTHSATKQLYFKVVYEVDMLQPANIVLMGLHSTIEFNQDSKDLAKKREFNFGEHQNVVGESPKALQKAS